MRSNFCNKYYVANFCIINTQNVKLKTISGVSRSEKNVHVTAYVISFKTY